MTIREVYEYVLIELNKRKAPSLLLKDYNYFFWKGIVNYAETKYNNYDKNQQRVDDLEAITVIDHNIQLALVGRRFAGDLPEDYFHILNCEVVFEVVGADHLCYVTGDTFTESCGRLPSGAVRHVEKNYYFKPSTKRPYFYQNSGSLEIRSGDTSKYAPKEVYIDYLKKPEELTLTQDQIDDVEDTSAELEFRFDVCLEIVKEITKLLLENSSDPRLQTNIPVNQTVA